MFITTGVGTLVVGVGLDELVWGLVHDETSRQEIIKVRNERIFTFGVI